MKTLTLIRHAKSDWSVLGQKDFDRGLSDRGNKQIKKLAKILKNLDYSADKIMCSTAVRARITLDGINNFYKNFAKIPVEFTDEIYNLHTQNIENFADYIRFFDDNFSHIIIVGYNPLFDNFIAEYTTSLIHMPTASVAEIVFDIDLWTELKK